MIKEKVHEDNRKADKTPLMIYYTNWNNWILRICLWQNERQPSVNHFWFCKSGNYKVLWSLLYMIKVLASFIRKSESDRFPAPAWKWVSTEGQRFLVLHLGWSKWPLNADIDLQLVDRIYWCRRKLPGSPDVRVRVAERVLGAAIASTTPTIMRIA